MMTNPFDHHFGRPGLDFGCFTSSHKLLVDCFVFWECFFFFFYNRREYIEKAIKRIAKEKYKGYKKEKRKKKKTDLLQQTTRRLPKISYYTTIWCHQKILRGHFMRVLLHGWFKHFQTKSNCSDYNTAAEQYL
jgi:hypothetical protein